MNYTIPTMEEKTGVQEDRLQEKKQAVAPAVEVNRNWRYKLTHIGGRNPGGK